jgi:hypothetical protein
VNRQNNRHERASFGIIELRNIDTMIALVMLFCSDIAIPWPSCNAPMRINTRANRHKVA